MDKSRVTLQIFQKYKEIFGIYAVLFLINIGTWSALFAISRNYSAMLSLGILAYVFGLRHAVDADHIAAIDNTTRKLLHDGKRPVTVGMYFSLGHSSVVFLLTLGVVVAVHAFEATLPRMEAVGTLIGTAVSASFLYLIAGLNFGVLREIWTASLPMRRKHAQPTLADDHRLERLLNRRGFMNRWFGRIFKLVQHSWQMYFIGFLFGLGFETASEVALLGISSSVTSHGMPLVYALLLPALFAAGMSVVDTSDGVLMLYTYDWAFRNPMRKIIYNMTVTTLSILIAFVIGTIEWLQIISSRLPGKGFVFGWINRFNFGVVGYVVIGIFIVSWVIAGIFYKLSRKKTVCEENVSVS